MSLQLYNRNQDSEITYLPTLRRVHNPANVICISESAELEMGF